MTNANIINPCSIYLADLRYYQGGTCQSGTCFPLSAGYISAFTGKHFSNWFDIRIFIDPDEMIKAIRECPPGIIGLANYSWNANLNTQMTAFAKGVAPQTVTVMGGPAFARNDTEWKAEFFERNSSLDFYIDGEGEFRFAELVGLVRDHDRDLEAVRPKVPKYVFYADGEEVLEGCVDSLLSGSRRKDLDEIPSPYVSGILDEFFEVDDLSPMIETVRGCPYACTFCCWGTALRNKVSTFSVERVKAEMDYIAARSKKCQRFTFGDANFGLVKRDVEIAKHLRSIKDELDWPNDVFLYFAKNSGSRVIQVASLIKDMTKVSLSRQTMSDEVLKNIKRTNLDDASYARLLAELGKNNTESMIELIYPLPGETRQSFIEGVERLFREIDPHRTEIRMYPTELLPGSEMSTPVSRRMYGLKTGWRRLSGSEGKFDAFSACDYQEIVTETDCFDMSDQHFVRKLHFYIAFFFTYRVYFDVTVWYVSERKERGVVTFISDLDAATGKSELLRDLFSEYEQVTTGEFHFGSQPPPDGSVRGGTDLDESTNGEYAGSIGEQRKHNIFYALKLLYGLGGRYRAEFNRILRGVMVDDYGFDEEVFDRKLAATEENIIDFVSIGASLDRDPSVVTINRMDHPGVQAFIHNYSGDTVDTLYGQYNAVARGLLDNMVLWKGSRKRDTKALEISVDDEGMAPLSDILKPVAGQAVGSWSQRFSELPLTNKA